MPRHGVLVPDMTREAGAYRRVALLGGLYSNYLALEAALRLVDGKVDAIFALGDFGAFGPYPDRTLEILRGRSLPAIQGNYEESLSTNADDCRCGYTDPRDNHFAQISYDYTKAKTSADHKSWMGALARQMRITVGRRRVLLSHGSPRKINGFLWRSTTPEPFIRKLLREHDADIILCTHTGLHWKRWLEPGRGVVNVGALGRPANDGTPRVWLTILEESDGAVEARFVPVDYDHARLAREMRAEKIPEEFARTIETGWWTTCLEILPAKERAAGRF